MMATESLIKCPGSNDKHIETRKTLWKARTSYLCRAQEIEREIERLKGIIAANQAQAIECRRIAEEFGRAAGLLGSEEFGGSLREHFNCRCELPTMQS